MYRLTIDFVHMFRFVGLHVVAKEQLADGNDVNDDVVSSDAR